MFVFDGNIRGYPLEVSLIGIYAPFELKTSLRSLPVSPLYVHNSSLEDLPCLNRITIHVLGEIQDPLLNAFRVPDTFTTRKDTGLSSRVVIDAREARSRGR